MKKKFVLRLMRLFTAIVGIGLHPASKLVDGVSGATRQKTSNSSSDNDTSTSDNSTTTSDSSSTPLDNSNNTNYKSPTIAMGWVNEGDSWAYIGDGGSKATGWLSDGGKWYYFSANGAMLTGWIQTNGQWYHMANSGEMQTGWIKDSSGSWYYLDSSGSMLSNTTIGGYTLGSDGRMR